MSSCKKPKLRAGHLVAHVRLVGMRLLQESVSGLSVGEEFVGAALGDARLSRRLLKVVGAVEQRPSDSFPDMMSGDDLEGFYRLVRNAKVNLDKVLAPHIHHTKTRAAAHSVVLVAHDTSEFRFGGEKFRAGLGRLGSKGQGFLGHVSLAMAGDGTREPLGVAAVQTLMRTQESVSERVARGELTNKEARQDPANESTRWFKGVELAEKALSHTGTVVHLMDSEGDNYQLMSKLVAHKRHFVIRLAHDRALAGFHGGKKLKAFLASSCHQTIATRTVTLSRRGRAVGGAKRSRQVARLERKAHLAVSATSIELRRSNLSGGPPSLPLNVVVVREQNAPQGAVAVEWILVTTEPIKTKAQVLHIVDAYRARWLIEEFFKALKTGCAIQKRQLESWDTLQVAFGIFIPIAWQMLQLRFLSRTQPERLANTVLSHTQLLVLHHNNRTKLPQQATVQQALTAIAKLGGHIKYNGPPGWIVIGRGFEKLCLMVKGFELSTKRYDQS